MTVHLAVHRLRRPRRARAAVPVLVAATAAALALTACGAQDSASAGHSGHGASAASPAEGRHNAQDVSFAKDMVPHHRQAVTMARLAPERASSPKVRDLARAVEKAQAPEIRTMSGWLRSWSEEVPTKAAPMPGTEHHAMPGMMSDQDMEKLSALSGTAFDRAFLTMMTGHHEGALTMAAAERDKGAYPPAKRLAASVARAQSAEIATMRELLAAAG